MRKKLRSVLCMILVVVLAYSLCACSKGTQKGFTSYDDANGEFKKTVAALNWPEDYKVPTELDGEKDGEYQAGYGDTRASQYWEEAWEMEWLKNYKTNKERADKAIEELEKATDMAYMSPSKCDDATRRYFKEMLDKAKAQDPSAVEENLKLNGPTY
ncbi:hypothetical protein PEPCOX59622_01652 [Aedoeadaptatus coxii]|uniref:hypothetical protein n=1 Tax=Aedoeadaptatus coxii TaxID=755172 RepID=UPI001751BAC3|nr:hypothetical protein [Peptoniphilus coxii]CAC9936637.1 hypothetical protein PEPCOX59622_01652 [Peptoniphilus coxii]